MDALLQVGLSNALLAAILAVPVAALSWVCRRPALTHGLWLLVVLRLIVPPLWPVNLSWLSPREPDTPVRAAEPAPIPESPAADSATASDLAPADGFAPAAPLLEDPPANALSPPRADAWAWPLSWTDLLLLVWVTGSGVWWLVAGWRLVQFRRLLGYSCLAPPALQEQVRQLAQSMGLARGPVVWVVPGTVSPMLWALGGRPRLLVPAALLERITDDQRATLLAHELAHLRRRDHWVRLLEFVATGLYWWHPILWWARREIEVAEEECCDAWVVGVLPEKARDYALALMETIDFLSEVRPALPLAASGIGHVHLLKRRLAMIMRGTTPRTLSGAGLLALVGLGALVLPLLPTWGQTPAPTGVEDKQLIGDDGLPPRTPGASKVVVFKYPDDELIPIQPSQKKPAPPKSAATADEARDEVDLLRVQLEGKQAELKEVETRLKQAQRRLTRMKALDAKGAISREEVAKAEDDVELLQPQLEQKRAQAREAALRLEQAQRRLSKFRQVPVTPNESSGATQPERQRGLQLEKELAKARDMLAETGHVQKKLAEELERARAAAEAARKDVENVFQEALKAAKGTDLDHLKKLYQKYEEELSQKRQQLQKTATDAAGLRELGLLKALEQDKMAVRKALEQALEMRRHLVDGAERNKVAQELNQRKNALNQLEQAYVKKVEAAKQMDPGRLKVLEEKLEAMARELEGLRKELKGLPDASGKDPRRVPPAPQKTPPEKH